jgi:pSer/pThr/pTyr-binding forkhead associated (FHA) protein
VKRFWELRRKEAQRAVADAATRLMPTAAAADEKLIVTLPGGHRQEFALAKSSIAIGRAAVNDIVLTDSSVSRRHARVERSAHGCEVVDLGAANGLSVNGVNVARALLKPGDVIGIGDCSFRFVRGMEDRSPQMTRIDNERELSAAIDETPLDVNLEETTVPRVVILTAAKTWEVKFPGDELTIGRDANNDVVIDSDSVSRHHAVIQRHNGAFVVRDLRSGNGTWIHDQKISHQAIDDGTTVRIGSARLVFKVCFETDDLADPHGAYANRTDEPRS